MNSSDDPITALYARAHEPLRSQLVRSVRGDRDLADDILQDTWLQAVRTWQEKGVPDRPAAWLATVARHLMLNNQRDRRRRSLESADLLDALPDNSFQADVSGRAERTERSAAVREAMSRLSQADKDLLSKFYNHNASVSSIAQSLGVSNRAIEGRLRRARIKLRHELAAALGDRNAPSQLPLLDAIGVGTSTPSLAKRFAMTAVLPFLAMIAFAPLAFAVRRLPRRQLAILRIVSGILMSLMATVYAPSAVRSGYAQLLQLFGVALAVWGYWMLRTTAPHATDRASP